ncbi:hypothetical protein D3C78_1475650 [compost metagenome]
MIIIPKLPRHHQQMLGVVRQHVLPGQTNPPMQLNPLVGNKPPGAADDELGRCQDAAALGTVGLVGDARGVDGH